MLASYEPPLTVLAGDFEKLSKLADLSGDTPVRRYLEHELDRAEIVSATTQPVVRLGARVRYHDLARPSPVVITLVMPHEADITEGRVSVLTPVGAALIGLTEGQRITYAMPWGQERTLVVVKVEKPLDA
ncbi:MAG: GreA/GreB family elongation factor [Proteobacteria bacterium]|nr:GreA/GreB family elongation factor [Pseudomonadota bacterium]